ncbi:hypothetical protein GTO27_09880 [Candidatus Bathyarchaeota archaeon]|nr:hypothetical protein [Candidatus Bathyarchaeota archaeon]
MPLTKDEQQKKEIDVLLAEYQACHRNRNHYDSVRWTIGSIFMATSLALFGISFVEEQLGILEVLLIAVFSFFLIFVWYAYSQHVNLYVLESLLRFHKIERRLCDMGFDISLHKSIHDRTQQQQQRRGIWSTFLLFVVVLTAWFLRIALLAESIYELAGVLVSYGISLILTYYEHVKVSNARNIANEIDDVWRKK